MTRLNFLSTVFILSVILAVLPKTNAFVAIAPTDLTGTTCLTAKADDVEVVHKKDLVAMVAAKMEIDDHFGAEVALTSVVETIMENVMDGKRVSIAGFGSFQTRLRQARRGRHPRTGEAIDIPSKISPVFTASRVFKEATNTAAQPK